MRLAPLAVRTLPFALLSLLAACADGAPVAPRGPEPLDAPVLAQWDNLCTMSQPAAASGWHVKAVLELHIPARLRFII